MIIEELNNQKVEDVNDMNDLMSECLTEYIQSIENEEGMERPVCDEDGDVGGMSHMWTMKAQRLIDDKICYLYGLGYKYFGDDADIDVSSHLYYEY